MKGENSMNVNTRAAEAVSGSRDGTDTLPVGPPPANHGRTAAGWTLFAGGAVAALVAGVGFILTLLPLIIAGAVVFVIGAAASIILRAAGYGQVQRAQAQE